MNRGDRRADGRLPDLANELAIDTAKRTIMDAVVPEHAEQITRVVQDQLLACIRSQHFATSVRELVRTAALGIAREILAELLPDLDAQVRSLVTANWEKDVAAAAHSILEAKLADIRRKLT